MRTGQQTKCLYHVSNWGWGSRRKTCFSPPSHPPVLHIWPFQGGGSDVVLCCLVLMSEFRWCFTLCLFIILLVRFGLLSGHLLGNSCQLGWSFVHIVFCLFVILVIFHFGFESGLCLVIAPVRVHCFPITFIEYIKFIKHAWHRWKFCCCCFFLLLFFFFK